MKVAIGIDSHKGSLAAAAVDELGRVVGFTEVANDHDGHSDLLEWRRKLEGEVCIGIECSGSYGNSAARMLAAAGEDVYEVPSNLSHREARRQNHGKSDSIDAVAIARVMAGAMRCRALASTRDSRTSNCYRTTTTTSNGCGPSSPTGFTSS